MNDENRRSFQKFQYKPLGLEPAGPLELFPLPAFYTEGVPSRYRDMQIEPRYILVWPPKDEEKE